MEVSYEKNVNEENNDEENTFINKINNYEN